MSPVALWDRLEITVMKLLGMLLKSNISGTLALWDTSSCYRSYGKTWSAVYYNYHMFREGIAVNSLKIGISLIDMKSDKNWQKCIIMFLKTKCTNRIRISFSSFPLFGSIHFWSTAPGSSAARHPWVKVVASGTFTVLSRGFIWKCLHQEPQKIKIRRKPLDDSWGLWFFETHSYLAGCLDTPQQRIVGIIWEQWN